MTMAQGDAAVAEIWLQHMTWEEIGQRIEGGVRTVILPIGSTEQHGPHLPIGTDTLLANAVAEEAAQRTDVFIAPPLWFGWSPHHMILPGTITIRPEVLVELVFDVISSLRRHGLDNFVLLNGHRIVNVAWLQIVGERAKRELGVRISIFDPSFMSKEIVRKLGWGEIGHADEIESSHMWNCYPGLVKMDRVQDAPQRHADLYHVDPSFPGDTLNYVPSSPAEAEVLAREAGGVSGEPTRASREGGKTYHEHLVSRLVQIIEETRRHGPSTAEATSRPA